MNVYIFRNSNIFDNSYHPNYEIKCYCPVYVIPSVILHFFLWRNYQQMFLSTFLNFFSSISMMYEFISFYRYFSSVPFLYSNDQSGSKNLIIMLRVYARFLSSLQYMLCRINLIFFLFDFGT